MNKLIIILRMESLQTWGQEDRIHGDWGESSVHKVLATQAQVPAFHPQNQKFKKPGMVILTCNPSARQTDPWGLLAGQFSLFGKLQVNERGHLFRKSKWMAPEEWYLMLTFDLHVCALTHHSCACTYMCAYMSIWACAQAHTHMHTHTETYAHTNMD